MSNRLILFGISLLGGVLYALGFPSFLGIHFFLLPILGFALLFYNFDISDGTHWKEDLKHVLLFSCGFNLAGFYWIPYTLNEFGEIPVPLNYFLGLFFSLIILPQLYAIIAAKYFLQKFDYFKKKDFFHLGFWSALFTLVEGIFPQEFPAHIGHTWLGIAPHISLAPTFGAPIFSFFSIMLSLALCWYYRSKDKSILIKAFACFSVFLIINVSLPLKEYPRESEDALKIRIVQANIGNFLKLSSEKGLGIYEVYSRYRDLSLKSQDSTENPDLIIWPETAFPKLLSSGLMKISDSAIPPLFKEIIDDTKADLLVGGYDMANSDQISFESEYNTAFLFNHEGKFSDYYHKRILIPFGEHLPFGPFNEYLSSVIKNVAFFAKGERYPLFTTKKNARFINAICYEILFSSFVGNYLEEKPEAQFLVNLTNDSWYGDTAEPHQHQFLTHWRAIEYNLPIVRSTNTGITSILYPDGSQSQALEMFKPVSGDFKLVLREREKTIYEKWGYLPSIMLIMLLGFIAHIIDRKKILP